MQFSQITSSSDSSSRLASPPIGMRGTDAADTGIEGALTVVVRHDSNLSSDYRDTIQSFLPQYDSKKKIENPCILSFFPSLFFSSPTSLHNIISLDPGHSLFFQTRVQ